MILMYHKVHPEVHSMWWVDPDNFYRQMHDLYPKKVVYLDDYDPKDKNQVVITFDGVYENIVKFAAPILDKFGYPFELFVSGDHIGRENGFDVTESLAKFASLEDLKYLVGMGGRLQWHTKSHRDMTLLETPGDIRAELSVPESLVRLSPNGFKWFAYPHGNYDQRVVDEVKRQFAGAVSCQQGDDGDNYRLRRRTVINNSRFSETTVTAIIPSYNYGRFLPEALDSVLRQTIPPDKILIADDCSKDSTQEISIDYKKLFPELIEYYRNEENLGIVRNFNKAVSLTSSDYVFFLGADNRVPSNYIEETKKILDSCKDVGIAYTDFALFGPRAGIVYKKFAEEFQGGKRGSCFIVNFPEWGPDSREKLERRSFIHGSSVFRRAAYDKVGGYLAVPGTPEDRDLFLRIIRDGWSAKKAAGAFLEYRQHSDRQANLELATHAELMFYKEKCRTLLKEKERISSLLIYQFLKPLAFMEEAYAYFLANGAKAFFRRSVRYLIEHTFH